MKRDYAKAIRMAIAHSGKKQAQVIRDGGLSEWRLIMAKKGRTMLKLDEAVKLAEACNINVGTLLRYSEVSE